ncbi:hypothetical protein PGT21_028718 [Puccinia graminis f. sp. tritici]|uniref:Carnitine O-acetyltransferase n=2 Tax=Puccinia graminis f. sp. tritici TaxID=56615 RepID=E3JRD1_PUCGT|nr:carnitine O-acetyltransferase [Puccinia graminis f. sp. tritici CRL 75-36-700-3]EFP74595.1 carnitine O-acetyltransferase [Puccinia graminis f. sp. tritici CRL 75-36-700-3]KAA1114982.1 hypothetical protein PGT21_028718 [Puccinia graminis f. sp. tritici]
MVIMEDSDKPNDRVLPKLPIPPLEDTCARYIKVLEPLQTPKEHQETVSVVQRFLKNEGPLLHERLQEYASTRASYIEEFWYESYLQHSDSVVLSLNPFFILEDDPTPSRGNQLTRAASLILASVGFIHDLRTGQLEPDHVRGKPLDMHQYMKLFGSARIPTREGCRMKTFGDSKHVVVMRRGQFYSFDVMDSEHRPVLSERELWSNLCTIIQDADKLPISKVAQSSIGLLTTERRPTWAGLRQEMIDDPNSSNKECLKAIDSALFIVCLDGSSPRTADAICATMLCGTYELGRRGVQVGTCLNRWYDKLQIIVCADGQAGVNFEHSAVDGHTVLRFVGDVYTELILRFAKSINSNSRTLFKALPSPWAKPAGMKNLPNSSDQADLPREDINKTPKKLEWQLSNALKASIRFAETRLSDLICQNEVLALEFEEYGKNFIISQNLSPDAFVQMAFQVCYFSLYGRIESTYEPAMTKAFSHGRTEGIRSVSNSSIKFIKNFCSDVDNQAKISALREACEYHQNLSKQCSQGLGQDRILYAMYSLAKQELFQDSSASSSSSSNDELDDPHPKKTPKKLPKIFRDSGYGLLNHSTLSTSNCGNPALRLFGFGPVVSDGYGIGYIIREDGLSFVISSKHLQTRRFLESLRAYFLEIRKILLSEANSADPNPYPGFPLSITKRSPHRHHPQDSTRKSSANHRHPPKPLDGSQWNAIWNDKLVQVDHSPHLKDQSPESDHPLPPEKDEPQNTEELLTSGYGFFDSGEIDKIISSNAENVRNDHSKKKFKPPIGTKLEAGDD